jgi:DNA replication protein DnaC
LTVFYLQLKEEKPMSKQDACRLLKTNLKQLRLPTILAEHDKLAREASESNQDFLDYLLRLTELELATRAANALQARIRQASFPVHKDLDTFDFSAAPGVGKQKVLELSRAAWIGERKNCVLVGSSGTGKPRPTQYTASDRGLRGASYGH